MKKHTFILMIACCVYLIGCTNKDNGAYWTESKFCDSKDQCIELGEQYGDSIFELLEKSFKYSNRTSFLSVGLETDPFAQDGLLSFDDLVVAKYEKNETGFQFINGEDDPFHDTLVELINHLLFDGIVEVDYIEFLSDGYPAMSLDEKKLLFPIYFKQFSTENTLYFIIHELAHAITLNDGSLFNLCDEKGSIQDCFEENVYLDAFYKQFWSDLPEKWFAFSYDSMTYQERNDLYETKKEEFVSLYSVVSPYEDIAESFTHFILSPYNDDPKTVAEEKVNFFYQFDELVEYRTYVLQYLKATYEEKGSFY